MPVAWPKLEQVWAMMAFALPMLATLVATLTATDLAYQIRAGTIMLATHHVLRNDPFTFTMAGHPWLNQQWGAQVLMGLVWRLGGWNAVHLVWAALVGTTCRLLYLACRKNGAAPRDASLLTLTGYLVGLQLFDMRPQIFGILLFALSMWILAGRHEQPRRLWILPPIVVAWANLHGSFPLAFVLLGLAWAEDRRNHAALGPIVPVTALALVATIANPFGFKVWIYVVSLSTNPTVSHLVFEWSHPTPRTLIGIAFYFSAGLTLVYTVKNRSRIARTTSLSLGLFFLLAVFALRNVVWWALAAPVAIGGTLQPRQRSSSQERPLVNRALVLVILIGLVFTLALEPGAHPRTGAPLYIKGAPETLAMMLARDLPQGSNIFVSQTIASWVEFSQPRDRVMVDSRIELFPTPIWTQYFELSAAQPGWRGILARWKIVGAILNGQATSLVDALLHDSRWQLVGHADDVYAFIRR